MLILVQMTIDNYLSFLCQPRNAYNPSVVKESSI
jgi:hypothetical protein